MIYGEFENDFLKINGLIKTTPSSSAICSTNNAGGIYYNSSTQHFYGCDGSNWQQLDN